MLSIFLSCIFVTYTCSQVGIWFSTWYANNGKYSWIAGHGTGSDNSFIGDANGNGKDDSCVYFASTGEWYVSMSTGTSFGPYSKFIEGHGVGSDFQVLKDINNNSKADAVVLFSTSGILFAAMSTGSSFSPYYKMCDILPKKKPASFSMIDVTGDGFANPILIYDEGSVYVAMTKCEGQICSCTSISQWCTGTKSGRRLFMDVNGNKCADLIVFAHNNAHLEAHVHVSDCKGTFVDRGVWGSWDNAVFNRGAGSISHLKAFPASLTSKVLKDIVIYVQLDSKITFWFYQSISSTKITDPALWRISHGLYCPGGKCNSQAAEYSTNQFVGDVTGNGFSDSCVFFASKGLWNVLPNDLTRYYSPNEFNTWDFWTIKYSPLINQKELQYDSSDRDVISWQMNDIHEAGIDFLIFDETNGLYVDNKYIWNNMVAITEVIVAEHSPVRFSVAIGGDQFSQDPKTVEEEAGIIYSRFLENTTLAPSYFHIAGKPLLLNYASWEMRQKWEQYPDHSNTDKFTLRWVQGKVPDHNTPPQQHYGQYFGWGYPQGSMTASETMVAMPGWNNYVGEFVSRENGSFYKQKCLDRIKIQKPGVVVLNSYNEYAEETAVAVTGTENVVPPTEKWSDSELYWEMTKQFIKELQE